MIAWKRGVTGGLVLLAGITLAGDTGLKPAIPVVVELYTSEGCSSCPPADAVLSKTGATLPVEGVEVIPLSIHVDYWNRLGWADPWSSKFNSERQSAYARAFRAPSVYTPQMIVDGAQEFVGSHADKVEPAIRNAARESKWPVRIEVSGSTASVTVLPPKGNHPAVDVMFAVTESGMESNVRAGENSGRKLKHDFVAVELRSVGLIGADSAKAAPFEFSFKMPEGHPAHLVAFVQDRATMRILGAARVPVIARR
ncbi:MAG: DUF1223 domain-containing protein [Candidatus Sumerlaeaceae bacterium]|nr:DUF1223 domain-containing protein [Candidatus Sumerlaeaceae bacterium]